MILFSPADAPGLFTVSTDVSGSSGMLSVTRALDFETVDSYTVTLSVTNNAFGRGLQCQGAPQCTFSQTVIVEVSVVDENDHIPVFTDDEYTGGRYTHIIYIYI